jgi:hypothetical protein
MYERKKAHKQTRLDTRHGALTDAETLSGRNKPIEDSRESRVESREWNWGSEDLTRDSTLD